MHLQNRLPLWDIHALILLFATAFFLGCSGTQKEEEESILQTGIWRATLDLQRQNAE